jgi:hypothetical protein
MRCALMMSSLGHKRTFALQQAMSALPPIATSIAFFACLLCAKSGKVICARRCGVRRIMTMLDQSMIVQPQKPATTLSRKDWLFRANRALV